MKNYFKILGGVVAVCMSMAVGCTTVDDTLGLDLVPGDQAMKLRIVTLKGNVDTYTIVTDSIPTKSLGYAMFGYRNNATFGKTVAGSYVQYVTAGFDSTYYYGNKPIADSAFINLTFSAVSSEISAANPFGYAPEQTFGVYRTTEDQAFTVDSNYYYPGFDINKYIGSEPLFTFKHSGTTTEYKSIKLDYAKGGIGEQFLQELVNLDTAYYSKDDTTFINKMKGLYIAPMNVGSGDAAIYYCALSKVTSGTWSAGFTIWAHNYKSAESDITDTKQIKDTLSHSYVFVDDPTYHSALAFSTIKHDYTGSTVDTYLAKNPSDTIPNAPSNGKMFVQSMCGLGTFIRFTDDFLKEIDKLKDVDGSQYSNMVFNKAMMYLYLPESQRTSYSFDAAPTRFGMYYNFKAAPITAPDYNYEYEVNYQTALPYGGYLNRVMGRYEMDITTYVQRLLAEYDPNSGGTNKSVQRGVIFAPQFNSGATGIYVPYSQVELVGVPEGGSGAVGEPEFALTFTLIK